MVSISARGPIEAVTIRHEESAFTARLSTALGPVTIPAGTGPTEPQRARGQRIIIQDGGLSLSISVALDAAKKTFELLSFLSGWGWRTNGLLLAVRMDR